MDGITRMYQEHAHWLQLEINNLRREFCKRGRQIESLQQENAQLRAENARLKQQVEELTLPTRSVPEAQVPAFIKPAVARRRRRKPGRPAGHEAALRPLPVRIDERQEVALPKDERGRPCCPHCQSQLSALRHHRRLVEELIPAQVVTTCYRTHSGYCSSCRKRVESRAPEQPPAADLPHAQLGLNALATAAVLRVRHRLPLRQISDLLEQLAGLKVSPGALARQMQRLAGWLTGQYQRVQQALRGAGVVHADETGWRTDGRNDTLWALTNANHTLYHVDRSHGGKVIAGLLGKAFGGTLVSDFAAVYDQFDCPQQKCLTHLLRELRDLAAGRPAFGLHPFFRACKRLLKQMLRLKRRRAGLPAQEYARQVKSVETRLQTLCGRAWGDADADRLAARLAKYGNRLTTFLHDQQVEGTNNAAERALRPAVVMRKITGGSRSGAGARAWATLASLMQTAWQQGRNVLETIQALLQAAWDGKNVTLLTDTS
jgi:hypothetical protein